MKRAVRPARRARQGFVLGAALVVLGACGGGGAAPAETTDDLGGGSSVTTDTAAATTTQPGSSSKLVDVLWGTDGSGNLISVFPSDSAIAKAWMAANPSGTYRADLVSDTAGAATDPVTQAAEAQGGGAWQRTWTVTDGNELREATISVTVAVVSFSGKTDAVLAASKAGVPAGTETVELPGAPVSARANRWRSSADGSLNVYLDAWRDGTVVRCTASGTSVDPSSICGAVAGYLLDVIGDVRLPS